MSRHTGGTSATRLFVVLATVCALSAGVGGSSVAAASTSASGWSSSVPDSGANLASISCPSDTFCVAVEGEKLHPSIRTHVVSEVSGPGAIVWDGTAWSGPATIDTDPLAAVSCVGSTPASGFCVAVDTAGGAVVYNAGTWSTPTPIDGSIALTSVSCVSTTFCVAVDSDGNALTYASGTWSSAVGVNSGPLSSVSCASTSFCLAVDGNGEAFTYGGGSWSSGADIDSNNSLNAVSCVGGDASSAVCTAVDYAGRAIRYSSGTWATTPADIDGNNDLVSVSCPSASFCLAVDVSGLAIVYDGAWQPATPIDVVNFTAVSCASASFCDVATNVGGIYTFASTGGGTPPAAPAFLWADPGNGQVTVSWRPTVSGAAASSFNVYLGTTPGGESSTPVNPSPVSGFSYTVNGLQNGTTYYFHVIGMNDAGPSAPSPEAQATPHSALIVTTPSGTTTDTALHLNWGQPAHVATSDNDCPVSLCAVSSITATVVGDSSGSTDVPVAGTSEKRTYTMPSDQSQPIGSQNVLQFNLPPLFPLHGQLSVDYQLTPLVDVPLAALNFGSVVAGASEQRSIPVQNVSDAPVTIDAIAEGTGFSGGGDYVVAPGSSVDIPDTFTADDTGQQSGDMKIVVDGSDEVDVPTAASGLDLAYGFLFIGDFIVTPSEKNLGTVLGGQELVLNPISVSSGNLTLDKAGRVVQRDNAGGQFVQLPPQDANDCALDPTRDSCTITVKFSADPNPPPGICVKRLEAQDIVTGDFVSDPLAPPFVRTVLMDANVIWPNCTPAPIKGTIPGYVDPAGTVTYTAPGVVTPQPYPGATVTLSNGPSSAGPFTPVPDGSTIMSPANRTNPDTTDAQGRFAWDTVPGEYEVSATAPNCDSQTTSPFAVPPPVTNLSLHLSCTTALPVNATTTGLSASSSAIPAGTAVTLTATVSSGTGSVDFADGSTDLGSTVISGGQAVLTTNALTLGPHSITASYGGDATHSTSTSSPVSVDVTALPALTAPTFTLDTPPLTAVAGQTYSYPFGAVNADSFALSSAPAWLTIDPVLGAVQGTPPAGTTSFSYSVSATNVVGTTTVGPFDITVTTPTPPPPVVGGGGSPIVTATSLTSSANPASVGKPVVYTATVAPFPDGGTVSFLDNGNPITGCGAVPVQDNGTATCTTTYPLAGKHIITAAFSGSGLALASVSPALTEVVIASTHTGPTSTSTRLSSSVSHPVTGQRVVLTSLTRPAPDGGTVRFLAGGHPIPGCGAVQVNSATGRARCAFVFRRAGASPLQAAYSGDRHFTGSQSAVLGETVRWSLTFVSARVHDGAHLHLVVACAAHSGGCLTAANLSRGQAGVLAHRRLTIPAGKTVAVVLAPNAKGRHLLSRLGQLTAHLRITLTVVGTTSTVASRTVTLTSP